MTRAEKSKLEAKRRRHRAQWHKRKLRDGFAAYIKNKQRKKAVWQKKNAKKHTQHVAEYYERWGISGREARAVGKDVAVIIKPTPKSTQPRKAHAARMQAAPLALGRSQRRF